MKPYASYKPSGVLWLGDVPAHWKVNTIKRGYSITLGKMLQTEQKISTDVCAPYLRSANVQAEKVDVSDVQTMWFSEHEMHQLALQPNDLVVCEGGDAGRSAIWQGEIDGCYFQNSVNRVRGLDDNQTRYLMYWLGVMKSCGYIDIVCNKATIAHLTKEKLADLPMLFPTPDEQQAIADYLDTETARIDTLIHEKDELIGLLREWRQSVIAEAVTKGLNRTAALKASEVSVLGEVPAHWEVKKIRYVLEAIGDVDHFMPESVEKGVPYLMTGDLKNLVSEVNLDDCKQVAYENYLALSKRIKTSKGDVVMARYATIGTAMYVDMDIDFLVSYSCVTLKPNHSKMSGLYLFQYMKSDAFLHGVENQINTNTQGNVGIGDLQNVMIAVPPLPEQKAICDYLNTETAKIDNLIAHTNDEIALLKELRSATIADAVLGRIDVRTAPQQ